MSWAAQLGKLVDEKVSARSCIFVRKALADHPCCVLSALQEETKTKETRVRIKDETIDVFDEVGSTDLYLISPCTPDSSFSLSSTSDDTVRRLRRSLDGGSLPGVLSDPSSVYCPRFRSTREPTLIFSCSSLSRPSTAPVAPSPAPPRSPSPSAPLALPFLETPAPSPPLLRSGNVATPPPDPIRPLPPSSTLRPTAISPAAPSNDSSRSRRPSRSLAPAEAPPPRSRFWRRTTPTRGSSFLRPSERNTFRERGWVLEDWIWT